MKTHREDAVQAAAAAVAGQLREQVASPEETLSLVLGVFRRELPDFFPAQQPPGGGATAPPQGAGGPLQGGAAQAQGAAGGTPPGGAPPNP